MVYVSQAQIIRAREIDLLSYLQSYEPNELVPLGKGQYCTKTHDSLKISNGKWYWWSQHIGGVSALDYLVKVKDMAFPEAVILLAGSDGAGYHQQKSNNDRSHSLNYNYSSDADTCTCTDTNSKSNLNTNANHGSKPKEGTETAKANRPVPFCLPAKAANNKRVAAYLLSRGIDREILQYCLHNGLLYEEQTYHNAVFVGKDEAGIARYAMLRGTLSFKRFIQEAAGSNKAYSFRLIDEKAKDDSVLHVFESAIDALSWATLLKQNGRDWQNERYLSLGGVAQGNGSFLTTMPIALQRLLENPGMPKEIHLRLDNDEAGKAASQAIYKQLTQAGYPAKIVPPPQGKDYNDYLCLKLADERLFQERAVR